MKKYLLILAVVSLPLALAGCCKVNCCCPPPVPDAASTPDLSSSADLSKPPDLASRPDMTYNPCTDRPCTMDSDCLPSYCRCSKPGGGKCSELGRCIYDPCAR